MLQLITRLTAKVGPIQIMYGVLFGKFYSTQWNFTYQNTASLLNSCAVHWGSKSDSNIEMRSCSFHLPSLITIIRMVIVHSGRQKGDAAIGDVVEDVEDVDDYVEDIHGHEQVCRENLLWHLHCPVICATSSPLPPPGWLMQPTQIYHSLNSQKSLVCALLRVNRCCSYVHSQSSPLLGLVF